MHEYKTFEELPKRIQYFVEILKSHGHTDIRNFNFPLKYFGIDSFSCKVWIDSEEMVQGKVPYRGTVQKILSEGNIKNLFGIGYLNISVHYKNKQQLGKKFLPELKRRLKESSAGKDIHSVRFDVKSYNEDPQVYVVLNKYQYIDTWGVIKEIIEHFKIELGYPYLDVRIN